MEETGRRWTRRVTFRAKVREAWAAGSGVQGSFLHPEPCTLNPAGEFQLSAATGGAPDHSWGNRQAMEAPGYVPGEGARSPGCGVRGSGFIFAP